MAAPSEEQGSSASRKQRLFGFIFLAVIGGPLTVSFLFLLSTLQFRLCPADTFLVGPTHPDLQEFAVVVCAVSAALLIEYWIAFFYPKFGKLINLRFRKRKRQPFLLFHLWSNILVAALCISFPLLCVAALSNFCLDRRDIESRIWPWDDVQTHEWGDVVYVRTACWRGGRGSWPAAYVLGFKDGHGLDIANSLGRKTPNYPELRRALRGTQFIFNAQAVGAYCGNSNAAFLRTRP